MEGLGGVEGTGNCSQDVIYERRIFLKKIVGYLKEMLVFSYTFQFSLQPLHICMCTVLLPVCTQAEDTHEVLALTNKHQRNQNVICAGFPTEGIFFHTQGWSGCCLQPGDLSVLQSQALPKSPRHLIITSQPIEPTLMKEVLCTLPQDLLSCLLQTFSLQTIILSIVSQSREIVLVEEATGTLQKT